MRTDFVRMPDLIVGKTCFPMALSVSYELSVWDKKLVFLSDFTLFHDFFEKFHT